MGLTRRAWWLSTVRNASSCSPYNMASVVTGTYTASGKSHNRLSSQPGVQGTHEERVTCGYCDHLSITWADEPHFS